MSYEQSYSHDIPLGKCKEIYTGHRVLYFAKTTQNKVKNGDSSTYERRERK